MSNLLMHYEDLLGGGDLRSIGQIRRVIEAIRTQPEFDALFKLIDHPDRRVAMRAADGVDKITVRAPSYLVPHKHEILQLLSTAHEKEIKWHLALLLPRLRLTQRERDNAWKALEVWLRESTDSQIVRVNVLQALYHMSASDARFVKEFKTILHNLQQDPSPSLQARMRKIKRSMTSS